MAKIKTKARTLDMLGRQQIAGIPTALSELFKNAHDAYADNVEVDYIRKKNLLILRDNGLGMTLEEFEERWLTLGTDSKFEDEDALSQPVIDNKKDKRQVMGEKGIGRLAIAAIGPQVLVMTRAKRDDQLGELVAAFINWTLFSLPALDLSDIEIPIITKCSGENITLDEIENLKLQSKNNIKSLLPKISIEKINNICAQIDEFNYDPEYWTDQLNRLDISSGLVKKRSYLNLNDEGYGTHFVISPVEEMLNAEIDNNPNNEISKLKKVLLGFTNTIQKEKDLPIKARFRDHNFQGECVDYLDEENFFTQDDFNLADHHFVGRFDEYGQFHGYINIFGQLIENVTIPWMDGKNNLTNCGAFDIHLASLQGRFKESRLAPELHNELSNKTNQIGGLYIYRDGIRVLPYGGPEFDFLGIELRRTKRASDYYFSYRNMIGYIDINKTNNFNLQEKAGREGFIENKAYKQFKSILENFFITVAKTYFVDSGEMSELFIEQRNRNKEIYEALEKRQKLKSEKKKRLQENLRKFFDKVDQGIWDTKISILKENISTRINDFNLNDADYDDFIFHLEETFRKQLYQIRDEIKVNIPSGIGFGKDLTQQIDFQLLRAREIEQSLISLQDWFNDKLAFLEDLYGDRKDLKRRLTDSFLAQEEMHKKKVNEIYKQAEASIESLTKWASEEIKRNRSSTYEELVKVKEEFAKTNLSDKNTQEIYELKKVIETKLEHLTEGIVERIDKLTAQINVTKEGSLDNQLSSAQLTAVLEEENEHLKEQHDENMEMIQLGMALGVVHHEFNNNIISVRRGLREFKPWAEKNQKLYSIYEKIRIGFDHLDGYLRIFTPLSRRLSRKQIEITGKALSEFVKDVFDERCNKDNVVIEITQNFMDFKIEGYASTIYPALVNIIDNALYWVLKSSIDRKITLDVEDSALIIKDSGPGIQAIDNENIFEFGFSRRIGGRGMGLYVTRQTLEKDGFQISLDSYIPTSGAIFRISKKNVEEI